MGIARSFPGYFAPFLLAAGAAVCIAVAPAASAASSADCEDDGPAAVCTRNGHAAIYANPGQAGQQFTLAPGMNPFGAGPMPPLLAVD